LNYHQITCTAHPAQYGLKRSVVKASGLGKLSSQICIFNISERFSSWAKKPATGPDMAQTLFYYCFKLDWSLFDPVPGHSAFRDKGGGPSVHPWIGWWKLHKSRRVAEVTFHRISSLNLKRKIRQNLSMLKMKWHCCWRRTWWNHLRQTRLVWIISESFGVGGYSNLQLSQHRLNLEHSSMDIPHWCFSLTPYGKGNHVPGIIKLPILLASSHANVWYPRTHWTSWV